MNGYKMHTKHVSSEETFLADNLCGRIRMGESYQQALTSHRPYSMKGPEESKLIGQQRTISKKGLKEPGYPFTSAKAALGGDLQHLGTT